MDVRDTLQESLGPSLPIERELGGGGMSRVYLARDTTLGRQIVVKVLPHDLAASVSTARFNREVALAAKLQHPHIVPLLSAGEAGGTPYFTMPFVEGESLRDRLRRQGELPVSEAVRLLREIASALAYAHERGVVHRDIKPDNVLISGGSAIVADFGIAKALSDSSENSGPDFTTSVGIALGTPAYMSPEQALGDPTTDHRADIYAFGVLAYELLTAETPFAGRSMQGQLAANIAEKPESIEKRRPALPAALAALVMRCLEKRPADRPQTAADIVRALDEVKVTTDEIEPLNLMAALESTTVVARSEYYRNRGIAVLAIVGLAIAGWGVYAWRTSSHTQAAATASAPKSIAVLPLENVGGDTAMQFFADGITDELTSTVSRLPGVQVTSRSATAAAATADGHDTKKIGDRLHVGALLEGRMRRVGDRMRLTMNLTNVSSGVILWSDTYESEVKDAFQVQDSVARAIAGALRVTLGVNQQLASRGTTSAKAHDLYLRGRYVQGRYTEPDLRKSLELFQAALTEDPNYVQAWSGVANSWGRLSGDFMRSGEAMPRMRDALARGLAIDSTVPELRFTRGAIEYFFDRDPLAAQRDMVSALSANPDLDYATDLYPQVLWTNALRDSAAAFLRHSVDRDPTSPDKLFDAWQFAQKTANAREARDYCGRLGELGMSATCEALQDLDVGRADAALKLAERARQPGAATLPHGDLAYVTALVAAHRLDDARKFATDLAARALAPGSFIREDDIALMYGWLGDNDAAIKWYERSLASHSAGMGSLYWRTMNNPIRKDPRLLALARRAGLPNPPPYWP